MQVVTSPLKRCIQTASLLFPGIPSECCDGLKECDFGRFEYHNYMELSRDAEYQRWIDSNGTLPFPGGESQKSFQERCCQAFLESVAALRQAGCASVAYVVHGGTIMALMERFCTEEKSYFDWQVKNQEGFACEIQDAARVTVDARFMQLTDRLPLPEERLHKSGIEDVYVVQKNERLQCGYTTGSCATAASLAATRMLFTGKYCRDVRLLTPKGVSLDLEIVQPVIGEGRASCAVRKFGGDDPDATDGLLIFAEAKQVSRGDAAEMPVPGMPDTDAATESAQVLIDGGAGVGRVTKPGLEQPIGAAAINRVLAPASAAQRAGIFPKILLFLPIFRLSCREQEPIISSITKHPVKNRYDFIFNNLHLTIVYYRRRRAPLPGECMYKETKPDAMMQGRPPRNFTVPAVCRSSGKGGHRVRRGPGSLHPSACARSPRAARRPTATQGQGGIKSPSTTL